MLKFVEKPTAEDLPALLRDPAKRGGPGGEYLANMGIYVFKREALFRWAPGRPVLGLGGARWERAAGRLGQAWASTYSSARRSSGGRTLLQ